MLNKPDIEPALAQPGDCGAGRVRQPGRGSDKLVQSGTCIGLDRTQHGLQLATGTLRLIGIGVAALPAPELRNADRSNGQLAGSW